MAEHIGNLTLTDEQEKDWQYVLDISNAARSADDQLADVDALINLRLQELTQGCAESRRGEFVQRAQETLKVASKEDLEAVAAALKITVDKPQPEASTLEESSNVKAES